MAISQPGTWNILGLKLPDIGLTESFGGSSPAFNNPAVYQGGTALVRNTSNASSQGAINLSGTRPVTNIQNQGGAFVGPKLSGEVLGTSASGGGTSNQNNLIQGAQGDNNAYLQSLNTSFDQNKSQLEGQASALDQQFNDTQNFYQQQQGMLSGQVDTSKQQAQDTAANNQADALSTAQDVQRQNRNMLRALGILASSAGGELLAKPMGQYEKVRGQIAQQLTGRLNELNDFMNTKTSELSYAAQQARTQYDSLKNQISNDLRFNDRQRQDAIVSANQALQSRMNDIRLAMQGYTQQAASTQGQIAQYIQTLQNSNIGNIDTGAISDASIAPMAGGTTPMTASIYDQKKKLSQPNYYG